MRIEDRLKKSGWSDQELADVAPMLTNARFRKDLETQLDAADALADQNTKYKQDLDTYDNWFQNDIAPAHQKALEDAEEAEVARAAAEARLKVLQARGMQQQGKNQDADAMAEADRAAREAEETARNKGKNNMEGYVRADVFQNAFESAGDAIADGVDLAQDYQELYGSRLNMKQMRLEAKAARLPIRQYVETKFNFNAKRQEISAKTEADKLAAAERKGYEKAQLEYGGSNPNMQTLMPSNNTGFNRKPKDNEKQPWERTDTERANARVEGAYKKAVERGGVANV